MIITKLKNKRIATYDKTPQTRAEMLQMKRQR